jgi:hypothetical protein
MLVVPLSYNSVITVENAETIVTEPTMTLSQGGPVEMKIPVFEEEAVLSNHPNTNFDGNEHRGGLFVGYENADGMTRSWVKFNLSSIPDGVVITSAVFRAYLTDEWDFTQDAAIGLFYSTDDSWSETGITWNNQPEFAAVPSDVIDGPPAPDMFVMGNWYEWEVTSDVEEALEGDKMLTEVLKQVNESLLIETWKYFIEDEFDHFNATYLALEYMTPETTNLAVDGYSSSPGIDYIQSDTPTLSWMMTDSAEDYQKNYQLEVWDNEHFNDTLMWDDSAIDTVATVHDGSTSNTRPFGTPDTEFRFQFKYDDSQLSNSGVVDKLYFELSEEFGTITFENLQVLLTNTVVAGYLTSDFAANLGSSHQTQVLYRDVYDAPIIDNWLVIDVEDVFFLNALQSFIIELRFTNSSGDTGVTYQTSGLDGSVAYTWGPDASTSTVAAWTYDRTHSLKIAFSSDLVYDNGPTTSNFYPFGINDGTNPGIFQLKYNKSLIHNTGLVDRIFFPVTSFEGDAVYENFTIRLVESPVLGPLSHTDFESNYGAVEPTVVVEMDMYTVRNLGGVAVLELANEFYYSGEHDLLIELTWDAKVSGDLSVYRTHGGGGYRAYNLTHTSNVAGNDTRTYNMYIDFINEKSEVEYAGTALVNATQYYWRVRTMDSTGIWSPWATQSFTYTVLSSGPEWDNLSFTPDPGVAGSSLTVSIDVTYFLGVESVLFEFDGTNYSMSSAANTWSYTWTPDDYGNFTYTVYMNSSINTWNSTSGIIEIEAPTSVPEWDNLSFTPDPGIEGSSLTVSIDVTYFLGVESVLFEFDGTNYSMSATADTWSYTWTPDDHGNFTYTVYMESFIGTWSSTSGIIEIEEPTSTTEEPTPPVIGDSTMLLIIGGAAVIVLILVIILLKKRGT